MPVTSAQKFPGVFIVEDLFSLSIKQNKRNTLIAMQLHIQTVNTVDFPQTYKLLKKFLPRIFLSKCFNDEKLPFASEVRQTEIGHLFEHILLEYLCEVKLAHGYNSVTYSGRTFWNWVKNPKGRFDIVIDARPSDTDILQVALQDSIRLLATIMHTSPFTTNAISLDATNIISFPKMTAD